MYHCQSKWRGPPAGSCSTPVGHQSCTEPTSSAEPHRCRACPCSAGQGTTPPAGSRCDPPPDPAAHGLEGTERREARWTSDSSNIHIDPDVIITSNYFLSRIHNCQCDHWPLTCNHFIWNNIFLKHYLYVKRAQLLWRSWRGFPPLRQLPPDSTPQGTSSGKRLSSSRSGWVAQLYLDNKSFDSLSFLGGKVAQIKQWLCLLYMYFTSATEQVRRNIQ